MLKHKRKNSYLLSLKYLKNCEVNEKITSVLLKSQYRFLKRFPLIEIKLNNNCNNTNQLWKT